MSWLVRCDIPKKELYRKKLSDRYAWHQLVWRCFPGKSKGADRDFLFRVEENDGGATLYILGSKEPVCPDLNESTWQSRTIPENFLSHRRYHFDVICNPTYKTKAFEADGEPKKNSRRKAFLHQEDQKAWFLRKAKAHGFDPNEIRIDPCQSHVFCKTPKASRDQKQATEGTHIAVRFFGTLQVEDQAKFVETFHQGIGSARGFGFGLLLLAPIHDPSPTL